MIFLLCFQSKFNSKLTSSRVDEKKKNAKQVITHIWYNHIEKTIWTEQTWNYVNRWFVLDEISVKLIWLVNHSVSSLMRISTIKM